MEFEGQDILTSTALPTELNLDDWENAAVYLDAVGNIFAITAQIHTLTPIAVGDFDLDGDVDGADFLHWQRDFGSLGVFSTDGNRDGTVDGADLGIWQDYLSADFATTTVVPEPASLLLAAGPLAVFTLLRRRLIDSHRPIRAGPKKCRDGDTARNRSVSGSTKIGSPQDRNSSVNRRKHHDRT